MTYMLEPDGFKSQKMDLPRFAADLAKELGVTVMGADDQTLERPNEKQRLDLGREILELYFSSYSNRDRTVRVSIHAPEIPWNVLPTYGAEYKTASARVNPEKRPIATIAKDIKRRVIDASAAALAKQREYVAGVLDNRAKMQARAAELKATFPGLDIRADKDSDTATVYSGPSTFYVNARVTGYGGNRHDCVTIDRLGAISLDQFKAILKVLNKEEACKS